MSAKMPSVRLLVSATALAIVMPFGLPSAQTVVEPPPGFQPGSHETFLTWGTHENKISGETSSFGPFIVTLSIESSDKEIFDHTATLVSWWGERTPETSSYLTHDETGVYVISDGDPTLGEWYEYYIDPKLSWPIDLDPGGSVTSTGTWKGQWEISPGDFQAWTGEYSTTFTRKLEAETVVTPFGTFEASVYEEQEDFTQVPVGGAGFNETKITFAGWMVDDLGGLGSHGYDVWESFSDWNGDGTWNEHEVTTEYFTMLSVDPPPGDVVETRLAAPPSHPCPDGGPGGNVCDALDAVRNTAVTVPLSVRQPARHPLGSVGFLTGVTLLDPDAIDLLIASLLADGAPPEEAFLRMEFWYDHDYLAANGIDEVDLAPYWWDMNSNQWLLVGTTVTGEVGAGLLATLPEHENLVGYYGFDSDLDLVWMNVNHASLYGVWATPLPPAALLFATALAALGLGARHAARTRR